jgi:ribosomal protein L11 methylase PrmA
VSETPLSSTPAAADPASFRDPSGFVFRRDGVYLRQVNRAYAADWDTFVGSGLYERLAAAGKLVAHEEVDVALAAAPGAYKVLRPRQLAFVSYPYEWPFSLLKDAALLTLDLAGEALAAGMVLKDASAYNVQIVDGRPMFIDTLSFERWTEGQPWVAYRQFCQHFLAPLALMSRTDIRLGQLSRLHIDGVPLDLASALLPFGSKLSFGLGVHIHAHARSQRAHADDTVALEKGGLKKGGAKGAVPNFSRAAFQGLLDSLRSTVAGLDWTPAGTEWADYYQRNNNYGSEGLERKAELVRAFVAEVAPRSAWDLGANTGRFSRIVAEAGAAVVSWDIDPACVEANYRQVRTAGERTITPLLLDLTNPSPALGWANRERMTVGERGPVDLVLALGLIHHLAISNNVPLERVGAFLAGLGRWLVLEFVPKEDSQVVKLLATREDVFPTYDRAGFEAAFGTHFEIRRTQDIPGTARTLYLLRSRDLPG